MSVAIALQSAIVRDAATGVILYEKVSVIGRGSDLVVSKSGTPIYTIPNATLERTAAAKWRATGTAGEAITIERTAGGCNCGR